MATVSADTVVPSAACMLQKALGLPEDTPCFDLNAACTGFLYALHTMECLLNAAPRKFGLVVGAEALSKVVDWTDRGTCILFGRRRCRRRGGMPGGLARHRRCSGEPGR